LHKIADKVPLAKRTATRLTQLQDLISSLKENPETMDLIPIDSGKSSELVEFAEHPTNLFPFLRESSAPVLPEFFLSSERLLFVTSGHLNNNMGMEANNCYLEHHR
jgi:hypothetical protein